MKHSWKGVTSRICSITFGLLLLQLLTGCQVEKIVSPSALGQSLEGTASQECPVVLSTFSIPTTFSPTEPKAKKHKADVYDSAKKEMQLSYKDLQNLVGRLFVVGTKGTEGNNVPKEYLSAVQSGDLGGFIAYAYNVETKEQIQALNTFLCCNSPLRENFMRFLDLEGGRVNRLKQFVGLDSPQDLGRKIENSTLKLSQLTDIYSSVGKEVADCGFTMNLGPVVDLYNVDCPVIGKLGRSYSSSPSVVSQCAQAFITGFSQHGITTCLKHFPGHGSSRGDTHADFVDVTQTYQDQELQPYKELFESEVKTAVMPAHVVNKQLDESGLPATLSKRIITELLEEKLFFKGVIVSDAMDMGAVVKHYDPVDAACYALKAGVNVLIYSANAAANKKIGVTEGENNAQGISTAFEIRDAIVSRILEGDQELYQAVKASDEILRTMFTQKK